MTTQTTSKSNSFGWRSLRFKIVMLSLVVEIVMLSILVWNSTRLTEQSLVQQTQHRLTELLPVLNTSLAPPLLANDTATLEEVVQKLIREEGIYYAAVINTVGQTLVEKGQSRSDELSPWDRNLEKHIQELGTTSPYHIHMPIRVSNYPLGTLDLELDLTFIDRMSNNIRDQGLLIAAIEILLSIILLTLLGLALTRKLSALNNAAQEMANGDLSIRADIPGHDEVSETAKAFNHMAQAISQKTHDLHFEQNRLNTLLDSMNFGVVFADKNDVVEYRNQAFRKVWTLPDDLDLTQKSLDDLSTFLPNSILRTERLVSQFIDHAQTEIYLNNGQVILQTKQPLQHIHQPYAQGESLWLFEDITQEKESQQQLAYLAEHDVLTGLYNRYYFKTILPQLAKQVHRNNQQLTMFFFDLDEFKAINDSYGHEQGDLVLRNVTNSISKLVREEDIFFRLGGDEFAILSIMNNREECIAFAERITQAIASTPFQYKDISTRITSSLGIACYPQTAAQPEDLQSQADIAMYHAKKSGKNCHCFYDLAQEHSATTIEHLNWNERIDNALNNDLFELHYQGIYSVKTKQVAHLECLIRLTDPSNPNHLIYPDQFIPFAEKSGQILSIDRWVIRQAIKRLASNPNCPALAINISGKSFDEPGLPQYIGQQIQLSKIDPSRLLIELTETQAVSDINDAKLFIEGLHEVGCPVCLDDFGSGFSSFSYLKQLNVEILKIDGIFIKDLDTSYENTLFVESMQHVSRGMQKKTVAEFVENEEIFNKLKALGVDFAQGYYLDKPTKNHPAFL